MNNISMLENLNERKGVDEMISGKEKTVTKTMVKSMGFTDKLIKQLLPEPELADNPRYKCAPKMKLWKLSDVEDAMKNQAFQESLKKREKRKAAAEKAVATKKAKLKDEMDKFIESIQIEYKNIQTIRQETLKAKQDWYDDNSIRYDNVPKNAYDADEYTVIRWMVNYIRHKMTRYDEHLYYMKGRVGKNDMYLEIHNLILDKIAKVYPELAQECENQKKTDDTYMFC